MVKHFLILITFLSLFACNDLSKQAEKKVFLACDFDTTLDSTYNSYHEEELLLERIKIDGSFEVTSINDWTEGIRILGHGGWGEFDYVCSVYNDSTDNIIELAYRRIKPGNNIENTPFTYTTGQLTKDEYDSIIGHFIDVDFCDLSFDLAPNSAMADGPIFTVIGKSGKKIKTVTWHARKITSFKKGTELLILCRKTLRQAGYPLPTTHVYQRDIGNDSLEMAVIIDDLTVVDSVVYKHLNQVENEYLVKNIKVSDSLIFKKNIEVIVYFDGNLYYPKKEYFYDE